MRVLHCFDAEPFLGSFGSDPTFLEEKNPDYYYTVVNNNNDNYNAKLPLISLLLKFHVSDTEYGPECFNRLDPDPQHCFFVPRKHPFSLENNTIFFL
jgi:hypothetical protein